jgi:hypothetical protein
MEYITPYNRSQIGFKSLDELVEQDNLVGFIMHIGIQPQKTHEI